MELQDANDISSKFSVLLGHTTNDSEVVLIFVSFQDEFLAISDYGLLVRTNSRMPIMEIDKGKFTIWAVLENRKIISVKDLVKKNNITELFEDAEKLGDIYPYKR